MSEFSDSLRSEVADTVKAAWNYRDGEVVPKSEDVALGNEGVKMQAVFLYADLADSTELVLQNRAIAAEVMKSYLRGATRLIRKNGGEVRSFDGDRVMGVFITGAKNTAACKCALQINWFFQHALIPGFRAFYSSLTSTKLDQTVGVDAGEVIVVRGGLRNNNDLVWVGRPPNIAAKLSGRRGTGYSSLVTKAVYDSMLDTSKFGGVPTQNMWSAVPWIEGLGYGLPMVYGSTWWWTPE